MDVTDTEPEAPTLTMQAYLDEVDTTDDRPLGEQCRLTLDIMKKITVELLKYENDLFLFFVRANAETIS